MPWKLFEFFKVEDNVEFKNNLMGGNMFWKYTIVCKVERNF